MLELDIRKIYLVADEAFRSPVGAPQYPPLRKAAVCAVVRNPFSGQGYVEDLSALTEASVQLGTLLGDRCRAALGVTPESYGKAGLVGVNGEQEHVHAALTSVFGDAFRAAIGGGVAWISSTKKLAGPGTAIDVPLAFKDQVWVRSHYDAITVAVPDAPLPDELVVIGAVASRGRLGARVGGMTVAQAQERASR
jgi:hypothetical protein